MQRYQKQLKEDKADFVIYHCHDLPIQNRNWQEPFFIIISCDPGEVRLGFCILQCFYDGRVKTLVMQCFKIQEKIQEDNITIIHTFNNLFRKLDEYKEYHDRVHYVVIEKQIPGVRLSNHAIMNALISYYSLNLRNKTLLASIIVVNPNLKGKILGFHARKNIKADSLIKAIQILNLNNDEFINYIQTLKHKYDVADAYNQVYALLQSWKITPETASPFL
jgi:hypothetical protein